MKNGPDNASKYFLKFGLWFGVLVVRFIEKIIPSFRNKKENLYGIKDPYLEEFNLSNRERFKRNIKRAIIIDFGIVFWVYFAVLINYLFKIFNFKAQLTLLISLGVFFIMLFIIFAFTAYKISYKE